MNLKLKTYSFTLEEELIEDLRDDLRQGRLPVGASNLSRYLNRLIAEDKVKRLGKVEKKGNLSAWINKYSILDGKQKPIQRSNEDVMRLYADKFRR
jgi:hypothetical protein